MQTVVSYKSFSLRTGLPTTGSCPVCPQECQDTELDGSIHVHETVECSECCYGDLCNDKLCKAEGTSMIRPINSSFLSPSLSHSLLLSCGTFFWTKRARLAIKNSGVNPRILIFNSQHLYILFTLSPLFLSFSLFLLSLSFSHTHFLHASTHMPCLYLWPLVFQSSSHRRTCFVLSARTFQTYTPACASKSVPLVRSVSARDKPRWLWEPQSGNVWKPT